LWGTHLESLARAVDEDELKVFAALAQDVGEAVKAVRLSGGAPARWPTAQVLTSLSPGAGERANERILVVDDTDGKTGFWDREKCRHGDRGCAVQRSLPSELRPKRANEVTAIVVIRCAFREDAKYDDGFPGYAEDCRIYIVSRANTILRTQTLSQGSPHFKEFHRGVPYYSYVEAERFVEYIRGEREP
jgi:hypothetical protein